MAVLMTAKEISEELGISKTLAYQIMEKLNKELEANRYIGIYAKPLILNMRAQQEVMQ